MYKHVFFNPQILITLNFRFSLIYIINSFILCAFLAILRHVNFKFL